MWKARHFFISPSMHPENDYIRVVLRDYEGFSWLGKRKNIINYKFRLNFLKKIAIRLS